MCRGRRLRCPKKTRAGISYERKPGHNPYRGDDRGRVEGGTETPPLFERAPGSKKPDPDLGTTDDRGRVEVGG